MSETIETEGLRHWLGLDRFASLAMTVHKPAARTTVARALMARKAHA